MTTLAVLAQLLTACDTHGVFFFLSKDVAVARLVFWRGWNSGLFLLRQIGDQRFRRQDHRRNAARLSTG
jgi:hypothetical protein